MYMPPYPPSDLYVYRIAYCILVHMKQVHELTGLGDEGKGAVGLANGLAVKVPTISVVLGRLTLRAFQPA